MKIGTEANVTLDPAPNLVADPVIVVGVMAYCDNHDSIVLVASEKVIGMPINVDWLEPTGNVNETEGLRLRDRYLKRFPGTLKELA